MKLKFLLIIDAQNDFISGTLGSPEAQEARDKICNIIENGNYTNIFLTCDSHNDDEYLSSREGKFLPIKHCIAGTDGMDFDSKIKEAINKTNAATHYIVKNTFGSFMWSVMFPTCMDDIEIDIVGFCTDICVISNALIVKAMYPETEINVIAEGCAGSSPAAHEAALTVMKSCQIEVR